MGKERLAVGMCAAGLTEQDMKRSGENWLGWASRSWRELPKAPLPWTQGRGDGVPDPSPLSTGGRGAGSFERGIYDGEEAAILRIGYRRQPQGCFELPGRE